MNSKSSFGRLPAVFMLILSVGLVNHVLIVPVILNVAGRDSWLSPLLTCLIGILWISFPLYGTLKRLKEPFWTMVERKLGRAGAWLIKLPMLIILLGIAFTALIDSISWSQTTYLPYTPSYALALALLGVSLFAVKKGLRTIAFTSGILLPFVVILGDFVMSANMPHKDYDYLKPFLENGYSPVVSGALLAACSMVEIFVLVLYQHHIKKKFTYWQLILLMFILVLLSMGPLMGAIVQFGPTEATKMRYPAYSQWRLVQIGKYVEHLDFFAIYQWLSGSMVRIALSLYLVKELLGVRKPKGMAVYGWVTLAVLTVLAQIVTNHMISYRALMSVYFYVSGALILIVSLAGWLAAVLSLRDRTERIPVLKEEG
ncbi:spore germination protein (amino acid permease) [Paenibacillaceae bacterium GAS479]|nr:spore germination protein (amino acid permease) [Paenibacillaceae bacterium GAS479]